MNQGSRLPKRRICVVADDFGLYAGVDEAILDLVAGDRLQAFGCLTGGRSWQASASLLRNTPLPGVEIGLHFDLTERPLEHPAQPLRSLIIQAYARRLDLRAVRAEIRAQLNAFEAALGQAPDYVDGHQHVHQLPGIRSELIEELGERYPEARRPWLRCTVPMPGDGSAGEARALAAPSLPIAVRAKAAFIALLGGYALRNDAARHRFAMNTALLGVYGFNAEPEAYKALLSGWLATAADGAALMCHPARRAEASDAIGHARLVEYSVLASTGFAEMLDEWQIETLPVRDMLNAGAARPDRDRGDDVDTVEQPDSNPN